MRFSGKLLLVSSVVIFIFNILSFGQTKLQAAQKRPHFSFGPNLGGIGFGSFDFYNGINFHLINRTKNTNGIVLELFNIDANSRDTSIYQNKVNGVSVGLLTSNYYMNGIMVGLGDIVNSQLNGLAISFFGTKVSGELNGINVSYLYSSTYKINGFSFSMLVNSNYSNGIFLGLLSNFFSKKLNGISFSLFVNSGGILNGLGIAGLGCSTKCTNGLSIAPLNLITIKGNGLQIGLYNYAKKFNGIQLGIINRISGNRKWFRIVPFINLNFKRDPSVEEMIGKLNINLESGTMKDDRDGKVYRTLKINGQTWMSQDLNYRDSSVIALCYNDSSINCEKYGALYTLPMAKIACPIGWHLPRITEFDSLLGSLGSNKDIAFEILTSYSTSNYEASLSGFRTRKYSYSRGYTQSSYSYYYSGMESEGFIWSSSLVNDLNAFAINLDGGALEAGKTRNYLDDAFSVRCIKD